MARDRKEVKVFGTLEEALQNRRNPDGKIFRIVESGTPDAFVEVANGIVGLGIVAELRHGMAYELASRKARVTKAGKKTVTGALEDLLALEEKIHLPEARDALAQLKAAIEARKVAADKRAALKAAEVAPPAPPV